MRVLNKAIAFTLILIINVNACCLCCVVKESSDLSVKEIKASFKERQKKLADIYKKGAYKSQRYVEEQRDLIADLSKALVRIESVDIGTIHKTNFFLDGRYSAVLHEKEIKQLKEEK